MEKFQIDPNEEKRRHDEILKKLDPDLAKILQKHLTYSPSPEQEKKVEVPPEDPKNTTREKGPSWGVENSLPNGDR